MADKQVAIAGEIFDVNAGADHGMRYQIPAAEFEKMLEEAGMTRDGAKTTRSAVVRGGVPDGAVVGGSAARGAP